MKRLTLLTLIAIMMLAFNINARTSRRTSSSIPSVKTVRNFILSNKAPVGMKLLAKDIGRNCIDDGMDCMTIIYGNNVLLTKKLTDNIHYNYTFKATGSNACVIVSYLSTCHYIDLMFKDKNNFNKFLNNWKKSRETIRIESQGFENGWYYITFWDA